MAKYLLIIILSLFQDNFVRIGTILGAMAGFFVSEILQITSSSAPFTFGYIGWGIGVYLANYYNIMEKPSKKKFRFIKGGKF